MAHALPPTHCGTILDARMFDNLQFVREGAVALVTLDRPQSLNALNAALLDDLRRAALDVRRDRTLRALVITGAGDKAFAAGADIRELAALSPADMYVRARLGQDVFGLLGKLEVPVIAAVNGVALGGGCELAMACTLRVAADTARFGQPEVNLGLIPGFGGTQLLARLVGRGRALDLLLTGRTIDAQEALRLGLVDRVVPAPALLDETLGLAASLAQKPVAAVRGILAAVRGGLDSTLDSGLSIEASMFGLVSATADMREGVEAFLQKRTPVFKGE
jgi:enoyl-CoA hydratase